MFSLLLSSNGFNMAYNNWSIIVVRYSCVKRKHNNKSCFSWNLEKIWVSKVNQVYVFILQQSLLRSHVWDQLKAINFPSIGDYKFLLLIFSILENKKSTVSISEILITFHFYQIKSICNKKFSNLSKQTCLPVFFNSHRS